MVPRPGFEPGSSDRKSEMLGRATLPGPIRSKPGIQVINIAQVPITGLLAKKPLVIFVRSILEREGQRMWHWTLPP